MPLKLNVGLSKKVGLPRYGSLGAICHLEIELAGDLLTSDPEAFHRHVRNAYTACRQAVEQELARRNDSDANENAAPAGSAATNRGTNGHASANGYHVSHRHDRDGHDANGHARNGHDEFRHGGDVGGAKVTTPQEANQETDQDPEASYPGPASEKQHGYIRRLATEIRGLGLRRLDALAMRMFGKSMADLSSLDASSLIDTLKAIRAGEEDIDAAFRKAAS